MIFGWGKKDIKKQPDPPKVVEFGRYLHKPVTERAVLMVTGYEPGHFAFLIATRQLKLNGKLIEEDRFSERLESGQYVISHVDGSRTWRFFIA
jgi:hypothetical protein